MEKPLYQMAKEGELPAMLEFWNVMHLATSQLEHYQNEHHFCPPDRVSREVVEEIVDGAIDNTGEDQIAMISKHASPEIGSEIVRAFMLTALETKGYPGPPPDDYKTMDPRLGMALANCFTIQAMEGSDSMVRMTLDDLPGDGYFHIVFQRQGDGSYTIVDYEAKG